MVSNNVVGVNLWSVIHGIRAFYADSVESGH